MTKKFLAANKPELAANANNVSVDVSADVSIVASTLWQLVRTKPILVQCVPLLPPFQQLVRGVRCVTAASTGTRLQT